MESGRIKEVDALLMGQILQLHIATETTKSKGKSTYHSGGRMGPNPAYAQAQANVAAAEQNLERAREELRAARREASRFPSPPPPGEPPSRRNRRREAMQRLAQAEAAGAETVRGIDMLAWQGALAFEKWTGVQAPVDLMKREAIRLLEKNER